MRGSSDRADFEAFVAEVEPRLRLALAAAFGQESAQDATSASLMYAWENWERVAGMDNPAGYLYRVGRSSLRSRKQPTWMPVPDAVEPHVEPGLPDALSQLSEKQRLAVVLIHAYGMTRHEVADLVGISVSTIDTHLARGLARLRTHLGVESNV